jgi:hypothetical protein
MIITTAFVKSYFLVIVALASVAGSAIAAPYASNLVNVGSSSDPDPSSLINEATAQQAPYRVDHHLKVSEKAGDPLRIEENINDGEQHCEMACKYIEYQPGSQGKSALAFTTSSPVDLSGAQKVTFFLMGENGGEKVTVKIAGKDPGAGIKGDPLLKEKFELSSGQVTLSNDWQRYEVPLKGTDLKNIKAPFGMDIFKGTGSAKQVIYLKYIVYDNTAVDQRFLLPVNATGNATTTTAATAPATNATGNATTTTAATAPATNATGNATTTTIPANDRGAAAAQDNNSNTLDPRNENARGNNGRGNSNNNTTTSGATDVDSSDSGNEAPTSADNTTTGTSEEQISNTTSNIPAEALDNENLAPIAMPAVNSLVAHPGERVILDGSLSSDPDGDVITYRWSQSDGPDANLVGADTAVPTVTIPTVDQNDQITIDLVVSDGQAESNTASVIIDVQYVEEIEGAIQQVLPPADDTTQGEGWSDTECGGNGAVIVDCLTDSSDNTFVSSDRPSGTTDMLFSFQEPSSVGINSSNQIEYVTAQVTAKKTGASGFTSIIVDDPNDNSEHYSTPSISIVSDSFGQYSFTWNNNPITGQPWTADSLNSFVAGYRHLAGQGSIQISEFKLIVSSLVPIVEQAPPPPPPPPAIDEEASTAEGPEATEAEENDNDESASDEGDTNNAAPEDTPPSEGDEGDTNNAAPEDTPPSEGDPATDNQGEPTEDDE